MGLWTSRCRTAPVEARVYDVVWNGAMDRERHRSDQRPAPEVRPIGRHATPTMQRDVVRLLQQHPRGLKRREIRKALGLSERDVECTLTALRDREVIVLRRRQPKGGGTRLGRYELVT